MTPDITVPLRAVSEDPHLDLHPIPSTLRPGSLDTPIRWAHVSELPDPAPYLLGGELLLTAGLNLPTDLHDYVHRLQNAGIAALGFGLTPPLHHELPTALRDACTEHHLPLLTVPTTTPFLAISRAVALALDATRHRQQRHLAEARDTLTRAATRGLDTLTRALAAQLNAWIALIDPDDQPLTAHRAPTPLPAEARHLLRTLRNGTGIRTAAGELTTGDHLVAQPVSPRTATPDVLAVGRRAAFTSTERSIISVGAALLGLTARTGATTDTLAATTTALLLHTESHNTALNELLGPGPYRVLTATAHHNGPERHATGDWLRHHLHTPLLHLTGTRHFTAITNTAPTHAELHELLDHGWLSAVSSPTRPEHLTVAHHETRTLLHRAESLGAPLTAETPQPLADLMAPAEAAGYAERTLAPLTELDHHRGNDLIATLRTWLAHHGGWEPTATALGVHRNSVRHRITQIEHALGRDLADPETRMELWFALRWYEPDQAGERSRS